MRDVSVLIPALNEIYLEKTIRNVLENICGDSEILVGLDGYIPNPQIIINDNRVKFIHFKEGIGQRKVINELAKISEGRCIFKLDAHCAVAKGFDVVLSNDCEYSWTMVPRMYNLDDKTWKPKLHKLTDYMYIGCAEGRMLRAEYYNRQPKNDLLIDDTMCCMGPGWFMHKDRFLEQGGCDEKHEGGWGQQGVEVACKAWLSGGALKVNKKTWFAHWFRGGGGPGFPYQISGSQIERVRKYSRDLWLNDKWDKATRKFSWLMDKFNPPKELSKEELTKLNYTTYQHIHKQRKDPRWRGHTILKQPNDLLLYQQVIWKNKPDFIIETGTKWGGSAFFLGDVCELNGHGQVITIDTNAILTPEHKRVTYLKGSSVDRALIEKVKGIVGNGSVMVILDSKHEEHHCKWELFLYSKLVTPGQYMVIEDVYTGDMKEYGVTKARDWFLRRTKRFKLVDVVSQFLTGTTRDGWILRKS